MSFFDGKNIFFSISTSSVSRAALESRFLIFIIVTMASCKHIQKYAVLKYTCGQFCSIYVFV